MTTSPSTFQQTFQTTPPSSNYTTPPSSHQDTTNTLPHRFIQSRTPSDAFDDVQRSRSSSADSITALPTTDEEWAKVADAVERRRVQNRNAQRKYRKKCKLRAEELERRRASGAFNSPSATPLTRSRLSTPVRHSRNSSVPALSHRDSSESRGRRSSLHHVREYTPMTDAGQSHGHFSTFRQRASSEIPIPTTETKIPTMPYDSSTDSNDSHNSATSSAGSYPWLSNDNIFHPHIMDSAFSVEPIDMSDAMCHESMAFPEMLPYCSMMPPSTIFSNDFFAAANGTTTTAADNSVPASLSTTRTSSSTDTSQQQQQQQQQQQHRERAQSLTPDAASGRTMMHIAAMNGNRAMTAMLLERGADPNAKDCFGYTPLHLAVDQGHKEVADLLIDAGANIYATTEDASSSAPWAVDQSFASGMDGLVGQTWVSAEAV